MYYMFGFYWTLLPLEIGNLDRQNWGYDQCWELSDQQTVKQT